ncbi:MAG: hypothetical protein HUJ54_11475 [Erysipelotrichaceae bacterium]|nr:hypothetical protein [Erysipelotrichaceae bacterium]
MKTAVVYYSLEGNTRYAAEVLAKRLDADLIELIPEKAYPTGKVMKFLAGGASASKKESCPLKPYSFDAGQYDQVILGSPLWAGTIAPPLRTFLQENDLSSKRTAAFISRMGSSPQKAFDEITRLSGHTCLHQTLTLISPKSKRKEASAAIVDFANRLLANS